MLKSFGIAALAALSAGPALAMDTTAHQYIGGPVAQGHPYLVQEDGVVVVYPVPRTPLRYGVVDGRRVLIDPWTNRVVYILHP